jgi:hypothetical protein
MSCEASGNAEATPPDRVFQGTSKEGPYQSPQTANRKYLGQESVRVAGIMALPTKRTLFCVIR